MLKAREAQPICPSKQKIVCHGKQSAISIHPCSISIVRPGSRNTVRILSKTYRGTKTSWLPSTSLWTQT
jgi:hypothetical protein